MVWHHCTCLIRSSFINFCHYGIRSLTTQKKIAFENVGKGENAGNQHFLLFPYCLHFKGKFCNFNHVLHLQIVKFEKSIKFLFVKDNQHFVMMAIEGKGFPTIRRFTRNRMAWRFTRKCYLQTFMETITIFSSIWYFVWWSEKLSNRCYPNSPSFGLFSHWMWQKIASQKGLLMYATYKCFRNSTWRLFYAVFNIISVMLQQQITSHSCLYLV